MTTETSKMEKLTLHGAGKNVNAAQKELSDRIKSYQNSGTQLSEPVSVKYEVECVAKGDSSSQLSGTYRSAVSFKDALKKAKIGFEGKYNIAELRVSQTYLVDKVVIEKQSSEKRAPAGRFYIESSFRGIDNLFRE